MLVFLLFFFLVVFVFHLGLNRFDGFNKVLSVLDVLKDLPSNFNHLYLMQIPM